VPAGPHSARTVKSPVPARDDEVIGLAGVLGNLEPVIRAGIPCNELHCPSANVVEAVRLIVVVGVYPSPASGKPVVDVSLGLFVHIPRSNDCSLTHCEPPCLPLEAEVPHQHDIRRLWETGMMYLI
jgi:hypothetical protein